ncbi:alpha/beta fold hydrolase [Salibacteraceae bacterium]|nr:alpha/beta fold hydrolase [Salibacteraceae bacterium]
MDYQPPFLHRFTHFGTIIPSQFRKVSDVHYTRETMDTLDDDFIDLDYSKVNGSTGVLLIHGLEGSSDSAYMKGLTRVLNQNGMDSIAMNFRGCSGRPNNQMTSYHSGISADLETVVNHVEQQYDRLFIVGFSLGGNVSLKWSGEYANKPHPKVKGVVGISVPCDLNGSGTELFKRQNFIYLRRFLRQLKEKALDKIDRFDDISLDREAISNASNFMQFDQEFTAPVHGFDSAMDYYTKSSCAQFIPSIKRPALIINAKNDSFLNEACYPYDEVGRNELVTLLTPKYGGHVGFASNFSMNLPFWHEKKVLDFIQKVG